MSTACKDCRHRVTVGDGKIWYQNFCGATRCEYRFDPIEGRNLPENAPPYKYCREVNNGNCLRFSKKTDGEAVKSDSENETKGERTMSRLYSCPVCAQLPYYERRGRRVVYRCCGLHSEGRDDAGARAAWNAQVINWAAASRLTAWRVTCFLLALVVVLAAILALAMYFPSAVISP